MPPDTSGKGLATLLMWGPLMKFPLAGKEAADHPSGDDRRRTAGIVGRLDAIEAALEEREKTGADAQDG